MWTRKKGMVDLQEALGGQLIESSWGRGPYLSLSYKNWDIVVDYFVVSTGQSAITYTRLRTVFVQKTDFEFKISKEGLLSKLGKALGAQDIEVGDEDFDAHHIVKSNDELMITRLLNNEIKTHIDFHRSYTFELKKKNQFGLKCVDGEKGLSFLTPHVMKESEDIKHLVDLFQMTLDQLLDLGIISEEEPMSELYKEKQ